MAVTILWHFPMVLSVRLRCMLVKYPDHNHTILIDTFQGNTVSGWTMCMLQHFY